MTDAFFAEDPTKKNLRMACSIQPSGGVYIAPDITLDEAKQVMRAMGELIAELQLERRTGQDE